MALAVAEWKCTSDQGVGWTTAEFISELVIWAEHCRMCPTTTLMDWGTVKPADADNNRWLILTETSQSDVWAWVKSAKSAFFKTPFMWRSWPQITRLENLETLILTSNKINPSVPYLIDEFLRPITLSNDPGFTEIAPVAKLLLDFFLSFPHVRTAWIQQ